MARAYNFRSKKTLASIVIASALACGVAGCGTSGDPGTAFIVNDQSFSERDLSQTIDQWAQLSGTLIPRNEMVQYLVQTDLRLQAADDLGVAFSGEEAQETLEGILADSGSDLQASEVIFPVREMFRDLLLINAVQSGAISKEEMGALDQFIADSQVTLNPRYGTWNNGIVQAPSDLADGITSLPTAVEPAG